MKQLAVALLKSQREMGNAVKGSKNPFFKSSYADLNSIREAVIPVLNQNGISVLQLMQTKEGNEYVVTTLLHESGEVLASETKIVPGKANDPQALGSAISYARRYGLQAMLCIGAVDDDGEAAMVRSAPKASELTKEVVLARAQAAVAKKLLTKDSLLVELKSESVIDGLSRLTAGQLATLNTRLENLLGTK